MLSILGTERVNPWSVYHVLTWMKAASMVSELRLRIHSRVMNLMLALMDDRKEILLK